ncbi:MULTISPECIES: rhamnan synthesis F family protein [unclassified Rhizobium]
MKHYIVRLLRDEKNRRIAKSLITRSAVLTNVSRQILSRYRQGDLPAIEKLVAVPDTALFDDILASGVFDQAFYQRSAGRAFASAHDALRDYLAQGERNYLRPSAIFDPLVYRHGHRDLFDLNSSVLIHYLRHGRVENRLAALDFDAVSSPGDRPFLGHRPTVLLACHDASLTGAPILGYNIAEQLAQTCNVVILILRDGVLIERFREHASLLVVAPEGTSGLHSRVLRERMLTTIKDRHGLDYVVANSIEAANVASAAQGLDVPAITLMHEFAEYVSPHERVRDMVVGSQLVVFSSGLTAESARRCEAFDDLRNFLVLPQGKSRIPGDGLPFMPGPLDRLLDNQHSENRFLVIGCGYVQIRKGVDLFISVAHRLAQILGKDKVRFVWVGDGYNPNVDLAYSVWLQDQIARSGLQEVVTILPSVAAETLERLYASADAMMMSSRLDPFPNVTIDAMQAGLPVVCFAGASGTAEFLSDSEFDSLVAPYMDIDGAAGILAKLATEPDFHRDIGNALKVMAIEVFDMRKYVLKLLDILKQARAITTQEALDFETLSQADVLSEAALGDALGNVSSHEDRIRKYLRFAACGVQGVDRIYRRPILGFSPHIYLEHHPDLNSPPFENPLAHWIRAGRPDGRWYRPVMLLGKCRPAQFAASKLKVGLHIHLHYPEILDEMLRRIESNLTRPDLLITVTSVEGQDYVLGRTAGYQGGKAIIRRVPNLGRDFGPMITEFGPMLHEYDVVGHIHGKKSVEISTGGSTAPLGDVWREFLFENLVGGKTAAIDEILFAFEQRSGLGLIFPEDPNIVGWTDNYHPAQALCKRLGVHAELAASIEFPVGNMFYARPQALAPIFNSGLSWEDYPVEPLAYDGTILHAMERITPVVCEHQGFSWMTTEVVGFNR